MMLKGLALRDSNPRLADYEPAVLTAELRAGKLEYRVWSIEYSGDCVAGNCWHGELLRSRGGRTHRFGWRVAASGGGWRVLNLYLVPNT